METRCAAGCTCSTPPASTGSVTAQAPGWQTPPPHPPRLHPQGRLLAEPPRRLVADLPTSALTCTAATAAGIGADRVKPKRTIRAVLRRVADQAFPPDGRQRTLGRVNLTKPQIAA
jgi:hypothetical protein